MHNSAYEKTDNSVRQASEIYRHSNRGTVKKIAVDRDIELFQGLADLTRLRLICLLRRTGEICVCELVDALELPQYKVSRHLRILVGAGLVEDRRLGKWVYYRIARDLSRAQRFLLQAVDLLSRGRKEFRSDETRAGRRLKLRRNGYCCLGLN